MKYLKFIVFLSLLITVISCDKDDGDDSNDQVFDYASQLNTDNGFNFEFTYPDGKTVKETGTSVFGLAYGAWLDSDYRIGLYGGNENLRFDFRYSVPENLKWREVIDGEHDLTVDRIFLDDTGDLQDLEPELWFDSKGSNDEFDPYINVTGKIITQSNLSVNNENFGLLVEVKGYVLNNMGEKLTVEGYFWMKDAEIK
ncbi:hypothetical protein Q4566_01725 [Tamlana sp. 2_MG-2023]|uniref:hypothetical protein n=1 Tax=unclassified Tamlana TaxID=2614803 RepID=UPI0026E24491|nr:MULTISPECIES: hypothetical protein [unclassified Tamlana]MDO6758903.1 hypothetical protein [Tamlana sp. 2_MG-2023]MDO6789602.1 hypothetical protein [Tamlana sp. 1_MG-2023]